MTDMVDSTFTFQRNGAEHVVTVRHPRIDALRKKAIDFLCTHGCQIVPNVEALPEWLVGLDAEIQRQIAEDHLDFIDVYLVRVPETATIASGDLEYLKSLRETKKLQIAKQTIAPGDLRGLEGLAELEILVLIGLGFNDAHLDCLPALQSLEVIDFQSTSVTQEGAGRFATRFPGVQIYAPSMRTRCQEPT